MKILVLSDIHGNLNALSSCLSRAKDYSLDAVILLGDIIDYGMRSNEVIKCLQALEYPVICNIFGNHENAIINQDYTSFSSQRGVDSAKLTLKSLNKNSMEYIRKMDENGKKVLNIDGKKILAVHGNVFNPLWKSIETGDNNEEYSEFDFVLSGHSHKPHFFEQYYSCVDADRRNVKKTIFINPGSVGQPRNNNPLSQFAIIDTKTENVIFEKVNYDVIGEQNTFDGSRDPFYRDRLKFGV